jgi:hypothetical protein
VRIIVGTYKLVAHSSGAAQTRPTTNSTPIKQGEAK